MTTPRCGSAGRDRAPGGVRVDDGPLVAGAGRGVSSPSEAAGFGPETGIRYLSGRDVERLAVTASEIADRLETLLLAERAGDAWEAPKASIAPGDGRFSLALLSAARDPSLSVLKTVGLSPENTARGLPHIGGVIVVHDGETAMPVAILDARHITAVRTAAISLIAARRLAHPESKSIGFIGCGVQAVSHLDALASELPVEHIVAFSRRRESAEVLCAHARAAGIAGRVTADADDAISSVDIVVSSVPDGPGFRPFLDAGRLAPGTFATGVDLGRSWIPETFSEFDRVAVDDLPRHAAAPIVTAAPVDTDLVALIGEPRRTDRSARIAFMFRGVGLGDLAAASICLECALERDVGLMLER